MRTSFRLCAIAVATVALVSSPRAQQTDVAATLRAQIDRIYKEHAYDPPRFGPARWLPDGAAYAIVERAAGGAEIARYDAATGARSVMATTKLDVDDYEWSADGKRLLIFTNTRKVWRQNTRGDYYVIDVAGGVQRKLGGAAPEASLMFAKFSPDATRVAYVRQNNIYVERIDTGAIVQLTHDGTQPPGGAAWAPAMLNGRGYQASPLCFSANDSHEPLKICAKRCVKTSEKFVRKGRRQCLSTFQVQCYFTPCLDFLKN